MPIRILRVISTLDPASGGPMAGVAASVRALRALGHAAETLTLDAPGSRALRDVDGPVHAIGPSVGTYRYCPALVPWLRAHASRYDAIVVEGLWQYLGYAVRKALRHSGSPYFVFPHGMLDPWFKHHYPLKHVKKSLYWRLVEYHVLRDARGVCFTADEERRQARLSFARYDLREYVVTYGSEQPPQDRERLKSVFLARYPHLHGKKLWLFLGRLHEKKGCDLLVEAFGSVAPLAPDAQLVMAGPDQGGLQGMLASMARRLGVEERVTWTGMLQGDAKWGALHASDVLVLPSHQENFGVAVTEALGCGVPVLVSDKVNIWREIVDDGAGLAATDTLDGAADLLRRWSALDRSEAEAMRRRARSCFERRFTAEIAAQRLVEAIVHGLDASRSARAASALAG